MSSHSSHHWSTSTHPYPFQVEGPRRSTSTLASLDVPVKKTFLGRWKSAFRKEAMEALPEQGTLLSSFLTTPTMPRDPLAIPPIQHDPLLLLMQQTWQGTSYDSAWVRSGGQEHQFQSNLPAAVLGIQQPTPHSAPTFSGIASTFRSPPSSPGEAIPIDQGRPTQSIPPSLIGMSPYRSPSNLLLPQSEARSQSVLREVFDHPDLRGDEEKGEMYTGQKNSPGGTQLRSPPSMTRIDKQQSTNTSSCSEGSTRRWEESVHRRPSTSLPATPAPRYSPPQNVSTETPGGAQILPQPLLPQKLPTPPRQGTPLTLEWALYLLLTGKLTSVSEILFRTPLIDLFNHFVKELVEDPDWAVTLAGMDYTHYGYSYILKEEARHFACVAFNMIHQEQMIKIPFRY
ncbi:hypothetical protein ARMGADRAFT_1087633 [Armillaria gallica]|uniref:Uncharacterized protein n=1 Tax=Armillaria gallica TaxID=47427 RepID=A0A2H3D7Y8_ARMGA|nr:hypothetical protein ARMGADRAFT_1087633 [Armillaria gallica]